MKNCNDYIELLSAYADSEITGSDKNRIEYHLAECESCSALLEVYREISASINETYVDAPDTPNVPEELCIGVMNRVKNENIISAADYIITNKVKKRRKYSTFLMRYAPIAAGLVAMLLIWQFWGNIFGGQDDAISPMAMPAPVADEPAPAPEDAGVDGFAWDMYSHEEMEMDIALPDEDVYDDVAADTPEAEVVPYGIVEPEANLIQDPTRTAQETEDIMEFISGAYAEITFVGRLPALLVELEPLPFGAWFGWQMVFEIPSSEVPTLLTELGNREGLTVVYNEDNSDSEYAIVLFSPGR